jgi:DNA/RNA-binding domain of Phe-tRNA-synthetase-like protein
MKTSKLKLPQKPYTSTPFSTPIGLYNIKTKLEDLGLKYTEKAVYNDIVKNKRNKKNKMLISKPFLLF